jgi:hypothetical protein
LRRARLGYRARTPNGRERRREMYIGLGTLLIIIIILIILL